MPVDIPRHTFETGAAIITGRGFDVQDTKLRSGEISPFYVNLRNLRSFPIERDIVVDAMQRQIDEMELDFVADVPTAMTPLVTLLANRLLLPQITPRLDNKTYGNREKIDGVYMPGQRGALFEDTATTGTSLKDGGKVLTDAGLIITPYIITDREQGGLEAIQEVYPDAEALITVSQLLRIGHRMGRFTAADLSKCYKYLGKE
jgi:orotate phosphoribosyltransferase